MDYKLDKTAQQIDDIITLYQAPKTAYLVENHPIIKIWNAMGDIAFDLEDVLTRPEIKNRIVIVIQVSIKALGLNIEEVIATDGSRKQTN